MWIENLFYSSMSGMAAASKEVEQVGRSIANATTSGYSRSSAFEAKPEQETPRDNRPTGTSNGGVVGIFPAELPLQSVVTAGEDAAQRAEGADLGQAFSRLIQAQTAYSASLEVLKSGDEMSRQLISLRA
ncbi:hypothetical protein JCM17960_27020 [Magnetospira thiophila]